MQQDKITIRRAQGKDLDGIARLLYEVEDLHRKGRPDLFRPGARKYTDEQLIALFKDDSKPVFVAVDEGGSLLGYAFCQLQETRGEPALIDHRTLYIDDLCVDESARGRRIGGSLYEHVLEYARSQGCHNLTLHVWACNPGAAAFYRRMGLEPMYTALEKVLA